MVGLSYYNMKPPRRVTIMLADDVDKKIRELQANNIKRTQNTYSFSRTIDEALRKALKM